MTITITLNQIRAHTPCATGWEKLLKAHGKTTSDDAPFPLASIINSNGVEDAIWVLRCLPEHSALWRKFAVWCARRVEHLMDDKRSRDALDVAWRYACGEATDEELRAAHAAAHAAAWDAQAEKLREILDAGEWVG